MCSDDRLDDHLAAVIEGIGDGEVIPFLGAGVSARPDQWEDTNPHRPPTGRELIEFLLRKANYPLESPDLAKIAQYWTIRRDRPALFRQLHTIFRHSFATEPTHRLLTEMSRVVSARVGAAAPFLVVTTNYDRLVERAFEEAGIPLDLVYYDPHPATDTATLRRGVFCHVPPGGATTVVENGNTYRISPAGAILMKIHGTAFPADDQTPIAAAAYERDRYLITEDDYIHYLADQPLESALPTTLLSWLRSRRFLFLGYSLQDWNLRVFLRRLGSFNALGRKSWAVVLPPPSLEGLSGDALLVAQKARTLFDVEKEYWTRNDVQFLECPLERYVPALSARLQALQAESTTAPLAPPSRHTPLESWVSRANR